MLLLAFVTVSHQILDLIFVYLEICFKIVSVKTLVIMQTCPKAAGVFKPNSDRFKGLRKPAVHRKAVSESR
jgi:hypothetical protein